MTRLISGSSDGTVKVWSVTTGELQRTLPASKAEVRSVAYSPDGKWIAAGIRYGTVKVWATDDWKERHTWELRTDDVSSVAFTPDSAELLIGTGEWNRPGRVEGGMSPPGKKVGQLSHTGEVLSVAVARDTGTIAAGGADRTVSIWHKE